MESVVKNKILFVCLGNICRSPAAEGIMRAIVRAKGLEEQFEIDSAGTYGGHAGEKPDVRMRAAAAQRGYDLTHRSRRLCSDDFEHFDMVVAMDDSNYEDASRMAPDRESLDKLYRMVDFCKTHHVAYVPDPYYGGQRGFDDVLDILEDACGNLAAELIGK